MRVMPHGVASTGLDGAVPGVVGGGGVGVGEGVGSSLGLLPLPGLSFLGAVSLTGKVSVVNPEEMPFFVNLFCMGLSIINGRA